MIKPFSTKKPNWNYITCHHTHLQPTHRCCYTANHALAACGPHHSPEAKHTFVAKCKAPCSSRRKAHFITCTYATAPGVIVSKHCWADTFPADLLVLPSKSAGASSHQTQRTADVSCSKYPATQINHATLESAGMSPTLAHARTDRPSQSGTLLCLTVSRDWAHGEC